MEGFLPVSKSGERISIINSEGKIITSLTPYNGKEIIECHPQFSNGLLVVKTEDDLYGCVDINGKMIIEPKYNDIYNFSEGLGIALKEGNEEYSYKTVVLNTKGEELFIIKNNFDLLSREFNFGLLPVYDEGRYGFINKKGEFIKLPGKVEGIGDFNSKYLAYKKDSEWGLMSMGEDNEEIIKAKYNSLVFLSNDQFLVSDDGEYYVINKKGGKEIEFNDEYQLITPISANSFKYLGYDKQYRVTLLDKKGKPINKLEFTTLVTYPSWISVKSDYFNVDGFVQNMLDLISDKGIGKYYIGEPISQLNLDPSNYQGVRIFYDKDMNISGFKYNIDFTGYTNYSIAITDYIDTGWTYERIYRINPRSIIDKLRLTGSTKGSVWDLVKPKLSEGIQNKGYKLKDKSDSNEIIFSLDTLILSLNKGYYSDEINITIEPAPTVRNENFFGEMEYVKSDTIIYGDTIPVKPYY